MQRFVVFLLAAALVYTPGRGDAAAVRKAGKKHAKAAAKPVTAEAAEDNTSAPIRAGAMGARVLRAQVLLDRLRYSPGEIDARYGDDLGIAVRGLQEANGHKPTGTIDAALWNVLNKDTRPLMTNYTTTEEDVRGPFDPIPKEVQQQEQMKALGYESPQEALAEKFHVSPRLLAELNPGKSLKTAGEELTVPDTSRDAPEHAMRVVVSASKRTVIVYGARGAILAQFPATIGGPHDPLPTGRWVITVVEPNPWFYFDPAHLWNADQKEAKAKLPPGPNNPAGVVWMGLSKRHYGIHGTPDPGHIRHGESNGCIRLTNWDAQDLSQMVQRGTPAILEK